MSFIAKLPDWGLIHACGPDAQTFLHGQLTNDLLHLSSDGAQWSGYCTAKGRMVAGFLVWRDGGDGFYLSTDRALLPGLVKRLKMFVLRAKVAIEDCSERYAGLGIHGGIPTDLQEPMHVHRIDTPAGDILRSDWQVSLPAVEGLSRSLMWVIPADIEKTVAASGLPPAGAPQWMRLMVLAGEAWITQATQEAFVPQMINFDALDGINFKKGCYPGQEIVARAHYRGAVKRRMYRATVDAPAKAGDVLFASDLNGQESGLIALAAPAAGEAGAGTRSSEVLAVIQIQSHAVAEIRLGAPDGPLLRFAPLPYALPEAA